MPTVIAYHEVDDKDHWLASDNREKVLGGMGVTGIREFVAAENPSRVAVLMDVPDMDAFGAAIQSDEGQTAMAEDGVRADTMVMLVEAG